MRGDGGSVTWYEPLPVKTVSSAGDDPAPAETKLFEGNLAFLSWNFSLTSVTLFAVTIKFDIDTLVVSGPGGSAATVVTAFKDKFNFTWISQRLTLVIFNVTAAYEESKGKFSCELATSEGGWIRKIQVKIVERPQVVGVASDQDVCEHSEVTLSCTVTGKPEPNITWTRVWENGTDSRALQSKDGYLVMANISRSSNGTYRCTAFNGVGEPVNQTVKVIVRYPPAVEQVLKITVEEGGHVTKECKVTAGTPSPTVFWKIVDTSEVIYGKLFNITNIRRSQSGEYKCFASNTCGSGLSMMFIDVQYPPNITHIMNNMTVNDGDTVTLDCQADGNPRPAIRWIFNNSSYILGLVNITGKHNEGFYRCIAENSVGRDESTRDVYLSVFYYRPVNTTLIINTGDRSVILNQTFTITCDTQANPSATYEIFRDDGDKVGSNSVVTSSVTEVEGDNSVTFTCKASNGYGDGLTAKITLEVYYHPYITSEGPHFHQVQEGSRTSYPCPIDGNPPPDFKWYSGNGTSRLINSGKNLSISETSSSNSGWYYMSCNK